MAKKNNNGKGNSQDRPKNNLREIQENKLNETAQKAKVAAKIREAGIDMAHYWLPDQGVLDDLKPMQFFSKPRKQKTPLPYSSKDIRKFWEMPKTRLGQVAHCYTSDREVLGSYFVATENGGEKISLFALSIVCNANPQDKYTRFSIKLDMFVDGKEWLPIMRFDASGRDPHRNFMKNGELVKSALDMDIVMPPHLHIADGFMQLYGTNLGNDTQAYNQHVLPPEEITLSINDKNPVFNSFLQELAIKNGNYHDATCTATFGQIMEELARQKQEEDPNYFKNCVCFIGAMTGMNVAEMFGENVGPQWHFDRGEESQRYISVEEAVFGSEEEVM